MSDKISVVKEWLGPGSINIFGLPYSGKDTHGAELAAYFDGTILGGGDILRGSVIPPEVEEIMHRGDLVPSEDYARIVLPYLSKKEFAGRPIILSSVGRWEGEEQGVIRATAESGHPILAAVYLQIDPLEARERWEAASTEERGERKDDAEHVLENRFKEFVTKTLPVIQVYKELGLLVEIDGRPPKQVVRDEIIEQLFVLATR